MREIIYMVVVLTGISLASGGLLAALREGTQERIDQQVLEFVKGPSVRGVFKDATNDPIATRFQLKDGEAVRTFFVGEIEGAFRGVALEAAGKGYKGEIGLVVAIDTQTDTILAVGSEADVIKAAGPNAKVVDVSGKTVLPGFIEPHMHFALLGSVGHWPDLGPIGSISGVSARLPRAS